MPEGRLGGRFSSLGDAAIGWGFVALYALASLGAIVVLLAPVLVTLALKVNALVGIDGRRPAWSGHRGRQSGGIGR